MQRATQPQPFVPGPPPTPTAQQRANARWFLTLQAAFARGLSDREAIEEANRTVPEALDPALLPPEDAPKNQRARASPFLVTSIHGRPHSTSTSMAFPGLRRAPVLRDPAVHDPAVHDLIVPLGSDEIATWPRLDHARDDVRDDAFVLPRTCRSLRQTALDA